MSKRKTSRPKKSIKKTGEKRIRKIYLLKAFAGLGILILLVVIAAVLTRHLILSGYTPSPLRKTRVAAPRFEIYPKNEILPHKPLLSKPIPHTAEKLPEIAIIIDDVGYDKNIAEKFLSLDTVLTFSILPYSPYQKSIARTAHSRGFDVMLHLPMEPNEYPVINPGPGALLTSMSPDQLISQLDKDLKCVPFIKGVNNHMGSKMTTISSELYQIFSVLKKRNLFFIDSRTTTDTLCRPSAYLLQIPFAQKDVFIDHIQKADIIRKQIHRLIQIAYSHGVAVGIAHPHALTYQILREMLPELKKKATLVRASRVVHIIS